MGRSIVIFDPIALICGSHGEVAGTAFVAGLYGELFLAGLTGSLAHCGPMCGPLVIAQSSARLAHVPAMQLCESTRIKTGLLLPYHLGRLTSYGFLGFAMASFGQAFSDLIWFRYLSAMLLIAAAALLLWQGFGKSFVAKPAFVSPLRHNAGGAAHVWRRILAAVGGDLATLTSTKGYLLGFLLGFLPCGLLYAALAIAAASADRVTGTLGMLAFGLGTVPLLATIGVAGQVASARLRRMAGLLKPFVMTWNAGLLLLLAAAWIIET